MGLIKVISINTNTRTQMLIVLNTNKQAQREQIHKETHLI